MNQRLTRLLPLSGALLGLMAVSLRALPRERLLLPQAARSNVSLRGWIPVRPTFAPGYFWQSPTNALCFKLDAREQLYAVSVDVATGKQTSMKRLNALLAGTLDCGWERCVTSTKPSRVFCQPYMENLSLSPDGKRLLWLKSRRSSLQSGRPSPQWMVATLDGAETRHWNANDSISLRERAFWSPDSRHVVARAFAGKGLFTQQVDALTGQHREVSIPISAHYETLEDTFPARFSGVLANEELLFTPNLAGLNIVTRIPLCAMNLRGAIRRWALRLPFPARVDELKLSPQGRRFALLLHYDSMQAASPLMRRVGQALGVKNTPMAGIWVCSVDGSNLREVGHIPCPPQNAKDAINNLPAGLNWLPDELRLSFCCQDMLWTVPAD